MRRWLFILGALVGLVVLATLALRYYGYGSCPTYIDVVVPNGFRGLFVLVNDDLQGDVAPRDNGGWVLTDTSILLVSDLQSPVVGSAQFADGSDIAGPGKDPTDPNGIVCRRFMTSNNGPFAKYGPFRQDVVFDWYWVGAYADLSAARNEVVESTPLDLQLGQVVPGISP